MQDINDPVAKTSACCSSLEERVRENPAGAIMAALGAGIILGLVVRALRQPEPPRSHVKQLLEDIQERLHDLTDPALDRLHELAGEGTAALKKNAHRVDGVREQLRSLGCRVGNLFH